MSGRLEVQPAADPPLPWERAALLFTDGTSLRFVDVRKFGRLEVVDDPAQRLADIGPEPLEPTFTDDAFAACLGGRRGSLKATLLDPRVIAGLGNIYVDEALHRARLHPLRSVATLRAPDRARLRTAIVEVLSAALEAEGSSFDVFYRTPDGRPGSYQERLRVYGREGEACWHVRDTRASPGRGGPRNARLPDVPAPPSGAVYASAGSRPAACSRARALEPLTTPGRTRWSK